MIDQFMAWAQLVGGLTAATAWLTILLVEALKKAGLTGRRRLQTGAVTINALCQVVLVCVYGIVPWKAALIVFVLAIAVVEATIKLRESNETAA